MKLADRSVMPGDVVRRLIEGEDSQRGYVKFAEVMCDVQIMGKNKVICDIDSRDLEFIDVSTTGTKKHQSQSCHMVKRIVRFQIDIDVNRKYNPYICLFFAVLGM